MAIGLSYLIVTIFFTYFIYDCIYFLSTLFNAYTLVLFVYTDDFAAFPFGFTAIGYLLELVLLVLLVVVGLFASVIVGFGGCACVLAG
jgi:hypothetical protein